MTRYIWGDKQSGLLPVGFTIKTVYAFLDSSMRATYPAHTILSDWIAIEIFGEEYNL
jgi:hypothetical protein